MAAQEQATYNRLIREGKSENDALKIANAERAVTQAQINAQSQEATWQLQNQLPVAQAVGGAAKLVAQETATYNRLLHEGVSPIIAQAQAAAERAMAQAQINTAAKETLWNLQNQAAVSAALTGNDRIRAQAQATYNQLVFQGVEKTIASAVAAQQEANARAEVTAQVEEQVHLLEQSTELIHARQMGTEATVKAEQAYENAIRAGADAGAASALRQATLANEHAKQNEKAAQAAEREAAAIAQELAVLDALITKWQYIPFSNFAMMIGGYQQGKNIWESGGMMTQFNPAGYTSATSATTNTMFGLTARYGPGGFDQNTGMPNAQGLAFQYRGTADAAAILGKGLTSQSYSTGISGLPGSETVLDPSRVSMAQRAIELLPKEQQLGPLQQMLEMARAVPVSLEQAELVKTLTDKITELTTATKENTSATSAMTDVLSPFYSSDPRSTHLGFRAFAGGGIMTADGMLPLRQYQGGGMATSPQVAVFGEGSTPEAYVPVPSGRIPVEIKGAANNNQRPVNVTINVMGNADQSTVAALKTTAFQQAQAMRRVMR